MFLRRRGRLNLVAFAAIGIIFNINTAGATDKLVFDNQWDEFYKQLSTEETKLMQPGWRVSITLPPPPDDTFTRHEVAHIIALKSLRRQYQSQINAQLKDVVHPFVSALGLSDKQDKALRKFWDKVIPDITRVHMHFKAKFNRARPRQYSPNVSPSIAPPGHPAYPSGHATDSHVLALLLAGIWPRKKAQLLSIATQIALNREIAGVHYRSDTAAGYLLARQIVALLPRNPDVKALLAALRGDLTSNK